MELELKKLYKVIFPFTAVKADLGQKYGFSFAAFTYFKKDAKIGLDDVFIVENGEILMVIDVRKPPTRNREHLPKSSWPEVEYTFLNSKGLSIQTMDPGTEIRSEIYFQEIEITL
jgi:hypothetical protein